MKDKKIPDKFNNVPVEDDTKILLSTPTKFGKYDVLYQIWFWDGMTAESLIFVSDDIKNITMDELESEIRKSPLIKDSSKEITISSAKSEYTFFNFNFLMDYD